MKEKIKIIVATHKKYEMPDDSIYFPLQVGAEGKNSLGYGRDNTGNNISLKNSSFCELTGLYWAWKNMDADYVGLVHYRRHFTVRHLWNRQTKHKIKNALSKEEAEKLIKKSDIIVPKKQRYLIETLYSHYEHTHYKEHLDKTRQIIEQIYPEYIVDFDEIINQHSAHMFNMFIMKKYLMDDYCTWLFDILFELEKQMGKNELSAFQGRFYGRVSEIIFNCWLRNKKRTIDLKIKEIPCFYTEKIKWGRKGLAFAKAKFLHKKYTGSF